MASIGVIRRLSHEVDQGAELDAGDSSSNVGGGRESPAADRLSELVVILLVAVGVAFGEIGGRTIEPVLLPKVRGDGDWIA